eukprot:5555437-Pleurochrysis_carterae.AAC.3
MAPTKPAEIHAGRAGGMHRQALRLLQSLLLAACLLGSDGAYLAALRSPTNRLSCSHIAARASDTTRLQQTIMQQEGGKLAKASLLEEALESLPQEQRYESVLNQLLAKAKVRKPTCATR